MHLADPHRLAGAEIAIALASTGTVLMGLPIPAALFPYWHHRYARRMQAEGNRRRVTGPVLLALPDLFGR